MINRRHSVPAIAVGLALCLPPLEAVAAPEPEPDTSLSADDASRQEDARRLRAEAEERFFATDYDGALSAFQRAYELAPHPTDLFNMGRIHEEKGELAAALARYEEFVTQPRIRLEERAAAAERIKVLRMLVEDEARDDRRLVRERKDERAPAPEDPAQDDLSGPRDSTAVGRPLLVSGVVLTSIGAALALGGGLSFGLLARRDSDRIDALGEGQNPGRLSLSEAENLHARGRDFETLQIASLAAGVTLAGVGTGLLVAGIVRRHRAQTRLEAVVPGVTPHMAGLQAQWRF